MTTTPTSRVATTCTVRVQQGEYACRVRVDGLDNARRVLEALSRGFAFKSSEPMTTRDDEATWEFHLPYASLLDQRAIERLVLATPNTRLVATRRDE